MKGIIVHKTLKELIEREEWDSVVKHLKTKRSRKEAAQRDRWNEYPILFACEKKGLPLHVLDALLKAYPDGIRQRTHSGQLPIHVAVRNNTSVSVIQRLIDGYPEGLRQQDSYGEFPMHLAASYNTSTDVVQRLIEACPEGLQQRDYSGELPIHFAAISNTSTDVIQLLIDHYPEGLKQKNDAEKLPIISSITRNISTIYMAKCSRINEIFKCCLKTHPEAQLQAIFSFIEKSAFHSTPVINSLIEVCPELVKEYIDNYGVHMIHYVAAHSEQVDIVSRSLKICPEGLQQSDKEGRLPMHCAATTNKSVDVVKVLVEFYPMSVQKFDKKGWLPIHHACAQNNSADVIKYLIQIYPEGVQQSDQQGLLPLHHALREKRPDDIIKSLIEHYPAVLQQPDQLVGQLPLHLAASYTTSVKVINFLIDSYPEGLKQPDITGDLPIHVAAKFNRSEDVIKCLLRGYPEGIREQEVNGRSPKDLAIQWNRPSHIISCLAKAEEDLNKREESWVSLFEDPTEEVTSSVQQIQTEQQIPDLLENWMEGHNKLGQKKSETKPATLATLIEQKEWDAVSNKLTTMCGNLEASCVYDLQNLQYPIHHVCNISDTPLDIIVLLCKAYPKGLEKPDIFGRLPIHLASANCSSVDVIKVLIETYPEGVKMLDQNKELAIHHAAQWNSSADVVKLLAEAHPDGALQPNKDGKRPEDLAFLWNKTLDFVSCLTNVDKEVDNDDTNNKQQNTPSTNGNFNRFYRSMSVLENNIEEMDTSQYDILADDRKTLSGIFGGDEPHSEKIPFVSQNYLDACEKTKIGEGGNGVVFLAKDFVANLVFVIKEYHNVASAEKEIEILSQFQHPHIVRLLAQTKVTTAVSNGSVDKKCSLLLEYMPRGSLADVLDSDEEKSKLGFMQRIRIASNATTALCYFHNLGEENNAKVFHRDVKSANICLDEDYTAKIIDCGISKLTVCDATHATSTDRLSVGSVGYKAPEYAMDPAHYDEKCEVFSLGIVFVELLTGEKTQGASHYLTFSRRKKHIYPGELDEIIKNNIKEDSTTGSLVERFCEITMRCISADDSQRPTLKVIQCELKKLLDTLQSDLKIQYQNVNVSNPQQQQCLVCKEEPGRITCCGRHFLCERDFVDHVHKFYDSQLIPCSFHGSCGTYFRDEHIAGVSLPMLVRHVDARTRASERAKESSLFPILRKIDSNVSEGKEITKETQKKLDKWSTKVLTGILSLAGGRVSCPTLFFLVPENNRPPGKVMASQKEWWKNIGHKNWLLYFVCAHDRKPVVPPIQIKSPKDWLKKVAPALKLMLIMIQLTIKATTSLAFDLSVIPLPSGVEHDDQLEGMIEFTNSILGNEISKKIEETTARLETEGNTISLEGQNLFQQFGPDMQHAYDAIAAKAKDNAEWRNHMKQVSSKEGLVWVRNQYAKHYDSFG